MTATPSLLTYADAIERLVAFGRGQAIDPPRDVARMAILDAYDEIAKAHRWRFLERSGRILIHGQVTATVTYDHTGGTYERQLTASTEVFEDWMKDASLKLGSPLCNCDIESVKSTTVATLDATMNPQEDVASGTATIYQRWVMLPWDFQAFTMPMGETQWYLGRPLSMSEIRAKQKYDTSSGDIRFYAIGEAPDVYDRQALFIWPQPLQTRLIDFVYTRMLRPLRYTGNESECYAGTIAVTGGLSTVTGTDTAFASEMTGAILRIGTSQTILPTGRYGDSPFAEERSIQDVGGTGSLTLDANVGTSRSGVKYVITDPIAVGVAGRAFLRVAERNLAAALDFKNEQKAERRAEKALEEAREADCTTYFDPMATSLWPLSRIGEVEHI